MECLSCDIESRGSPTTNQLLFTWLLLTNLDGYLTTVHIRMIITISPARAGKRHQHDTTVSEENAAPMRDQKDAVGIDENHPTIDQYQYARRW